MGRSGTPSMGRLDTPFMYNQQNEPSGSGETKCPKSAIPQKKRSVLLFSAQRH